MVTWRQSLVGQYTGEGNRKRGEKNLAKKEGGLRDNSGKATLKKLKYKGCKEKRKLLRNPVFFRVFHCRKV